MKHLVMTLEFKVTTQTLFHHYYPFRLHAYTLTRLRIAALSAQWYLPKERNVPPLILATLPINESSYLSKNGSNIIN